jgi:hypothetical protein
MAQHTLAGTELPTEWLSVPKPDWLTEGFYTEKIQTKLASVTICTIASTLGVSESYAADIRAGRHRPHPRHWQHPC